MAGRAFPFAARSGKWLQKELIASLAASPPMIVCSCNVFSDHDVRMVLATGEVPRTTGQVYGCLGCSPQCGRCARTIRTILDQALASAHAACTAPCGAACSLVNVAPDEERVAA